ncbi:hypothetical protein [Desulfonema magnum]|uniref:Prevent-host-death family protein n=1 Tax=Desulfonema magnum TaxID=45655 RepID=A0A975BKY9_9BACT|nr:hypothetical protein [Desulfonema magnum]QTA87472.1 Uncharacterized protein dnm_035060 [Desulfonema magnum]
MQLNPQFIKKDGKNEFVILSYQEFSKIREMIEDYEDLLDLRKAKAECGHDPGIPLDEVLEEVGLSLPRTDSGTVG